MKVIKYGPSVTTLRRTCTRCATVVELEKGDISITRSSQIDEPEASYLCPGCSSVQTLDMPVSSLPPSWTAPVKR